MSRYGFNHSDCEKVRREMRAILVERAKLRGMIPYSDLVNRLRSIPLQPDDEALAAMLREIATAEDTAGRGLLTVIVVHRTGDMQPGPGFLELARELGRETSDIVKCWIDEMKIGYAYWSNSKTP